MKLKIRWVGSKKKFWDDIKELRKRKLEALSKQFPNKKIIVTKDNKVFIEK